jgi:hypothetical protein
MEDQLGPKEEHDPVTSLHMNFKATKAWAFNLRDHLGQKEPRTRLAVHLN